MLIPPACPVCGRPGAAPCRACWRRLRPAAPGPPPPGVDACFSLLAYEGAGRELLARLKYHNARSSLRWLAEAMAALVAGLTLDAVTWAPTSAARRRARGFDQAGELARAVARVLGLPAPLLLRRLPGPPQTGLPAGRRRSGPRFVRAMLRAPPPRLLLVDDVVTTGATLAAAAAALRSAGVTELTVVTAGRTPLKLQSLPADH